MSEDKCGCILCKTGRQLFVAIDDRLTGDQVEFVLEGDNALFGEFGNWLEKYEAPIPEHVVVSFAFDNGGAHYKSEPMPLMLAIVLLGYTKERAGQRATLDALATFGGLMADDEDDAEAEGGEGNDLVSKILAQLLAGESLD
jgi:hypothetical protein